MNSTKSPSYPNGSKVLLKLIEERAMQRPVVISSGAKSCVEATTHLRMPLLTVGVRTSTEKSEASYPRAMISVEQHGTT